MPSLGLAQALLLTGGGDPTERKGLLHRLSTLFYFFSVDHTYSFSQEPCYQIQTPELDTDIA